MARTKTLAQLRTLVRQRADQVNGTAVTDAELTSWINQSATQLWDMLVGARGCAYYESNSNTTTGTITSSATTLTLPATFYKLSRLVAVVNDREYLLDSYTNSEVDGSTAPTQSTAVKLYYVPCFTDLSGDSDTFDGINGWEEWVVADVARKVKIKFEEDPMPLLQELADLNARITKLKTPRDQRSAHRIADVTSYGRGRREYIGFTPRLPRYQLKHDVIQFREIV